MDKMSLVKTEYRNKGITLKTWCETNGINVKT